MQGEVLIVIIGVALGVLISAVLLRATIALYNKLVARGEASASVHEPSTGNAMVICAALGILNFLCTFVVNSVTHSENVAVGRRPDLVSVNQLICVPINLIVMILILRAMLPTTFRRALVVALFLIVIGIAIFGTLFGIGLLIWR